eukprot:NODE_115_length_18417_cov_0.666012.p4 type:complete len:399 gc:universal NODE_115_length_18417_cov_0.666012:7108-5912(-)
MMLIALTAAFGSLCKKSTAGNEFALFPELESMPNEFILLPKANIRSRRGAPVISTDGICGSNGKTCPSNNCCSQYGFCGSTAAHCAAGCQSAFSNPSTLCATSNTASNISTDGQCGSNGKVCGGSTCCSKFGFCGTASSDGTKDHCGPGCQTKFSTSTQCVGEFPKYPTAPATSVTYYLKAPLTNCIAKKTVALTFDDGPSSDDGTAVTLAALKSNGISSTFFTLGVHEYYDSSKTLNVLANGHEIASHSFYHQSSPNYLTTRGKDVFVNDMTTTSNLIYAKTGKTPRFFRPPYGDSNSETIGIWNQLGLKTVNWSIDTEDATNIGAGKTVAQAQTLALNNIKAGLASDSVGGHIVLCHDIHKVCSGIIPQIKKLFTDKGYKFVKLSECLGVTPYKNQ